MKWIILSICFLIIIACRNENKNGVSNEYYSKQYISEFRFFENDKVVSIDSLSKTIASSKMIKVFNWNDSSDNAANVYDYIIDKYGYYDETARGGIVLNQIQADSLLAIICDTNTYERESCFCNVSHIAFVYYDKNGKVIGQSNISFHGDGIQSIPKIESEMLTQSGFSRLYNFCKSIDSLWIPSPQTEYTH